jgi:hypothetical protein
VALILSLLFMSRMYMLFGLLVAVATNLLELFSLILHFRDSNVRVYPLSHILLTLRRLCFIYSTNRNFPTFTYSLPSFTVPFQVFC